MLIIAVLKIARGTPVLLSLSIVILEALGMLLLILLGKLAIHLIPAMVHIWNEVVEEGVAFPQLELLDKESGRAFFAAQTYCGVADDNGTVVGLYILHPNNVGRCGHIANASYAVDSACRGKHIGEQLVSDCLVQARNNGFKLMQFNAVVENNTHARHLYKRLGFVQVGMIPNGFLMKDGSYQNIFLYYYVL